MITKIKRYLKLIKERRTGSIARVRYFVKNYMSDIDKYEPKYLNEMIEVYPTAFGFASLLRKEHSGDIFIGNIKKINVCECNRIISTLDL